MLDVGRRWGVLVLGVPAAVGAIALLVVSRRGVYLSPDGLAYVGAARNLVDGHGLTPPPGAPPLGNFPPLYSLVLAAGGVFGPDPLTVARVLSPLLFGATIFVVGLMAFRLTRSVLLAAAAQLLVLSGGDFLAFHSAALSEPLFLLLTLLAVAAAAAVAERERLVVLAGLCAAAAVLTRYVGLALVAAGTVVLLAVGDRRRRWRTAIAFATVAILPVVAWLAWVRAVEGKATNRTAVVHAPDLAYFGRGLETASRWFLPEDLPAALRLAVAAAVIVLLVGVVVARRGRFPEGSTRLPALLAAFSVAYLLALFADRLLFDVTGRLDSRFLVPLHAAAVLLGVWALTRAGLERSPVALAGVGALVVVQLVSGAAWVRDAATDAAVRPGGFTGPRWVHSRVIADVRVLAPSTAVYTNDVGALHFHTGRVARLVPEKEDKLTGRRNPAYDTELRAVASALRSGGVLVYFTAVPARQHALPTPAELADRLGLQETARDEVGRLYRLPPA